MQSFWVDDVFLSNSCLPPLPLNPLSPLLMSIPDAPSSSFCTSLSLLFQSLTSDVCSHSFSLPFSLKTVVTNQWLVRRPDEDGLSASLIKHWSNVKDYIKDVSVLKIFLFVQFSSTLLFINRKHLSELVCFCFILSLPYTFKGIVSPT